MTEKEKMLAGKIYDPFSEDLQELRMKAHRLCNDYNLTYDDDFEKRKNMIKELMPESDDSVYLQGPIHFDFGIYTKMGKNSYANFNFTVLDICPVTIGENVFMGPNVSLLTALHPLRYQDRNQYFNEKTKVMTDKEYASPITIEDNCWICGDVTVLPGVTIGEGSVIGAGSVVTRNIPSGVLAFGNPCKVIRKITEKDSLEYHKELF